jgi:hypothetical protein
MLWRMIRVSVDDVFFIRRRGTGANWWEET